MSLNKRLILSYNSSFIYAVPLKTGKSLQREGSHWFPFGGLKSDFLFHKLVRDPCVLCFMDPTVIFPSKSIKTTHDLWPWILLWPPQLWLFTKWTEWFPIHWWAGGTPSGGVPRISDSGSRGIHLKGTEECLKDEHCQKVGNKEDLLPNKRKLWIQRKDICNLYNFLFYECIMWLMRVICVILGKRTDVDVVRMDQTDR